MSNRPCLRIVSGQSYRFSSGSWSECSVITASSASWCGGTYPWSKHVDDLKQEDHCKFQAILGSLWRLSRNRPRFPTLVLSPLAGVKLPHWPQHSHSGEFHAFGLPQVYLATICISILIKTVALPFCSSLLSVAYLLFLSLFLYLLLGCILL